MLPSLFRPACRLGIRTRCLATPCSLLHVCVVGSGPAGFYTAQHLLQKGPGDLKVDVVDRSPLPFGLVRYGVAPHHQDVKNVINKFTEILRTGRCQFVGNVAVGTDVTLEELRHIYDVIVLSYGASEDRCLSIPGEGLQNVLSAREFVGWYNGIPEDKDLSVDLSQETAVIFGLGNVALDVATVLLSPLAFLEKTDICEHALQQLRHSKVKEVFLVGRRGPLEVAFTIKECRELVRIADCRPVLRKEDFDYLTPEVLERSGRRRLLRFLSDTARNEPTGTELQRRQQASKEWEMLFCRSPVEILPDKDGHSVAGVKLEINKVEEGRAVATGEYQTLPCGLVFRSIGYRGSGLDSASDGLVQFDERRGVIPNDSGRTVCPGVYCSGWIKHGPSGTIASTLIDARETASCILHDLESSDSAKDMPAAAAAAATAGVGAAATDTLLQLVKSKGVEVVMFEDWQRIDKVEVQRGEIVGKPREKVVSVEGMLQMARDR